MHHQTLPKIKIYTELAFPIQSMKDQVKMRDVFNQLLLFAFQVLFMKSTGAFHEKHTSYEKRRYFSRKARAFQFHIYELLGDHQV